MNTVRQLLLLLILATLCSSHGRAQRFFNLTAQDVAVNQSLPIFKHAVALPPGYEDSVYTVSITYPEFIDMPKAYIERARVLAPQGFPTLPKVEQTLVINRKQGSMEVNFCPVVEQDGKYKLLVGFMLRLESRPKAQQAKRFTTFGANVTPKERYTTQSVLNSGRWAKIKVPASGVYQLTPELVARAGFNDIEKVKIYGYGGLLQNEKFIPEDLIAFDDLQEVPQCVVNGKHLFYAKGTVHWATRETLIRTRNPYSDYGYYFITQSDEKPQILNPTEFLNTFYPSNDDFHALYEIDNYAWFEGGRNLFDRTPITPGSSHTVTLSLPKGISKANVRIGITSNAAASADIYINGQTFGNAVITWDRIINYYDHGKEVFVEGAATGLGETNTVIITNRGNATVRLDYIAMAFDTPRPAPNFSENTFPTPDFVGSISNQNLHADKPCDMVIIIPTSQKLLTQAQRLAQWHADHDGMSVRIVTADKLFNEFSSGTPDANAYRKYLKMLYDRAQTEEEIPRHLLLFGDCAWDNRMNIDEWKGKNPDDYLLCFESENSFNAIYCYADEGWFTLLDDGEGDDPRKKDKADMSVGRIPAATETDAKTAVDKALAYMSNEHTGAWQNELLFMGDDGNNNLHMNDADKNARLVENTHPEFVVKRVMWDAYPRVNSAGVKTYPGATEAIKRQQQTGALIMNYSGHGIWDTLSDEYVLRLPDFAAFKGVHLPLWITASCDIMPFDGAKPNIGETALFNPDGGAVAFYGTTRTVYVDRNRAINQAFLKQVLKTENGKAMTLGEAQRLAKNELIATNTDSTVNKLQYALLGDPAMALRLPTSRVIIDSVNDMPVDNTTNISLSPGTKITIKGHVENPQLSTGVVSILVRDVEQNITCLKNDPELTEAFTFFDRPTTLYQGSDSIRNGQFTCVFALPKEMSYQPGNGSMNFFAQNNDGSITANGVFKRFTFMGEQQGTEATDSIGPKVFCYLNTPEFSNGGKVGSRPFFAANISDSSGINASGSGVGHQLELIIDNNPDLTFNLNNHFSYNFGSYTEGSIGFQLPELTTGKHQLMFRAWDLMNNSTTSYLQFEVQHGLAPQLFSVGTTTNPASTSTTFLVNHDLMETDMELKIEVFDLVRRRVWVHTATQFASQSTATVNWNLTDISGNRLPPGLYIYRVSIASNGSKYVSKAQKLIIAYNN